MNESERALVVRKVADYVIDQMLLDPMTTAELKAIALDVIQDTIGGSPDEIADITQLAIIEVSNDKRVRVTRTLTGQVMWFERKPG